MKIAGSNIAHVLYAREQSALSGRAKRDDQTVSSEGDKVSLSPLSKGLAKALSMNDQEEKVRPDAIARGQELISQWQDPSDEQVDKITQSLLNEV